MTWNKHSNECLTERTPQQMFKRFASRWAPVCHTGFNLQYRSLPYAASSSLNFRISNYVGTGPRLYTRGVPKTNLAGDGHVRIVGDSGMGPRAASASFRRSGVHDIGERRQRRSIFWELSIDYG